MPPIDSPRCHLLLPWAVQQREDPVLEFDRGEGVYFYDRQGRRYLDFLSQLLSLGLSSHSPRFALSRRLPQRRINAARCRHRGG